jgi:hypothetical protein
MPSRLLNTDSAITSANRLTESTTGTRRQRSENEVTKFVNIRFKETEYKSIGALANEAGITKAAFCKTASLYIAEMVKAEAFTINSGVIIDRRKV